MTRLLRTSIVAVILVGLAAMGYWRITMDQKQQVIDDLKAMNAQMEQRLTQRQAMIERLSRDRRVAHLEVIDQPRDESGAVTKTTVRFIELDEGGSELARQEFTVPGDMLFIDAWTVKFEPDAVAQGDPLMGRTLILLRRVYSDRMAPIDGFTIDTPGAIPPGYAASDVGKFEQGLWRNFWNLALDEKTAQSAGVRVAQGEAVYKPVKLGQTFELTVDNAGGMNLTPREPSGGEALTNAPADGK